MSDSPSSQPKRAPEWDDAWELVRRLGVAHKRLAKEVVHDHGKAAVGGLPAAAKLPLPLPGKAKDEAPLDPDELARAIAEIERASAALRRAEPALETWSDGDDDVVPASQPANPRSVWVLIGILWTSTVLVAAGVVYAIATLIG
jgi:hypothetical protein